MTPEEAAMAEVQAIVRPEEVKPFYNSDNPWAGPCFLPEDVAAIAFSYGVAMARFHYLQMIERTKEQECEFQAVGLEIIDWSNKFLEMKAENYGR